VELTSSQSILKDLLETQELENGEIDRWVKSETTLVWTKGRVELYTISSVDLGLEFVVLPNHSELDDSLWDGDDLEGGSVFWLLFEKAGVLEGGNEFCRGGWLVSHSIFGRTQYQYH
jgi:hypothetical protein